MAPGSSICENVGESVTADVASQNYNEIGSWVLRLSLEPQRQVENEISFTTILQRKPQITDVIEWLILSSTNVMWCSCGNNGMTPNCIALNFFIIQMQYNITSINNFFFTEYVTIFYIVSVLVVIWNMTLNLWIQFLFSITPLIDRRILYFY